MCCVFFREAKPDLRHVQQDGLVLLASGGACQLRAFLPEAPILFCRSHTGMPHALCNAVGPMGFRARRPLLAGASRAAGAVRSTLNPNRKNGRDFVNSAQSLRIRFASEGVGLGAERNSKRS